MGMTFCDILRALAICNTRTPSVVQNAIPDCLFTAEYPLIFSRYSCCIIGTPLAIYICRRNQKMFSLRQKLTLGFGGMLAIIIMLGIKSILLLSDLGQSINVILRENYRSVIACQDMKEAIERMDSGTLFTLLGYEQEGNDLINANAQKFEKALQVEVNNITVPGEGEKAGHIRTIFSQYKTINMDMDHAGNAADTRKEIYFKKLLPLFQQTKDTANEILHMNQQNMSDANDRARAKATAARQQMGFLLFAGALVAVSFIVFTRRWILYPIRQLIASADDIKKGNLNLFIQAQAHDEFGRLSEAFNDMASSLREFRRSDQAKLTRMRHSTEQAFKSLPDAIAVIDMSGAVEVATESARSVFGLSPGSTVQDGPYEWMGELYAGALKAARPVDAGEDREVVQCFVQGDERFFQPKAAPILDNERLPTGVVLTLRDVTQQRHHDDMKRGLVSTVSHQLKTPLTSIRMAVHLLLEEKVGTLNEKQAELLIAARDDSNRLYGILEDLLDITRIESGRAHMNCTALLPQAIVTDSLERFMTSFQDQDITLELELPGGLPEVWADTTRIGHVFDNLISNALKHTATGGTVTVSAQADEQWVVFSVTDTGAGIPEKYLNMIFEQFFRVPGQDVKAGAGLGLAIAREIVEAHGGKITVESTEGKGSTFRVTLKRADSIAGEGKQA